MPGETDRIFLDANVLAAPLTRTLLIAGARLSRLHVTWSRYVENEADRHIRAEATPVADVRRFLLHRDLSPLAKPPTTTPVPIPKIVRSSPTPSPPTPGI